MHPRAQSRRLASLSPNQALLTAAVMAALAVSVPAQLLQFEELPRKGLPVDTNATSELAMGDVDGDGDLDLVCGNYFNQNRLYVNDGTGRFTDVTAAQMPVDFDFTTAVALGDVDGDGDLDVIFGNAGLPLGQQNRLYMNNGVGTFTDATATQMPVDNSGTRAVALGDVDGDTDLDMILGNGTNGSFVAEQNRLYLNNGAGSFVDVTAARLPVDADNTGSVVLGDVDGDGDVDVVLGNTASCVFSGNLYCYGQQNRLYLNSGTGTFTDATAAQMPIDGDSTRAAALGDIDGDGDLDLVFANGYISLGYLMRNRLYVNNGGVFSDATASQLPVDNDSTLTVALGDVDADGDLDMVLGGGSQNRLYLNDGSGLYTDATGARLPVASQWTHGLVLGDADADGDLDVVEGNSRSQNRLYFNLRRQLHAPVEPQIGQPYTFDIFARYGPPRNADFALPYVSTAPASIPVPPFGILGIDPVQAVPLPWVVIPQPAGVASSSAFVPNDPALIGLSAHSQALLLQPPLPARLTNVTVDVIR